MSDELAVNAMLGAAGLVVPPDELAELIAGYPALRKGLDTLHGPEFSGADPYLVPSSSSELRLP